MDSGLALTAGLLQSPYFLDYEGYQRGDIEGVEARGYSAGSRLYDAADGWLYIHCPDGGAYGSLLSALNFRDIHEDGDAIAEVIRGNTIEHWMQTLRPLGVSVSPNLTMEDYRNDPVVRNAGFVVTREHTVWGSVDHSGTMARLSATPPRLGPPAPWFGMHTDEILAEAGYSATEIEALKASGAAVVRSR